MSVRWKGLNRKWWLWWRMHAVALHWYRGGVGICCRREAMVVEMKARAIVALGHLTIAAAVLPPVWLLLSVAGLCCALQCLQSFEPVAAGIVYAVTVADAAVAVTPDVAGGDIVGGLDVDLVGASQRLDLADGPFPTSVVARVRKSECCLKREPW
jgi:hypothetical protein